jgi:hypothetical protein
VVLAAAHFEREVGHLLGDLGEILDALLGQAFARKCSNRERNIDQAFLAAARGDDDLAVVRLAGAGGFGCGILRIGRRGKGGNSGATGKQQRAAGECLCHGVCSSPGPLWMP